MTTMRMIAAIWVCALLPLAGWAQLDLRLFDDVPPSVRHAWHENLGQLSGDSGVAVPQVRFYSTANPAAFLTNEFLSVAAPGEYAMHLPVVPGSSALLIQVDQGTPLPLTSTASSPEWGTFYGGGDWDGCADIDTDTTGNMYVTGGLIVPSFR